MKTKLSKTVVSCLHMLFWKKRKGINYFYTLITFLLHASGIFNINELDMDAVIYPQQ